MSGVTSISPKSLLVFALLLLAGSAAAREGPLVDRGGAVIHREFLPHNKEVNKKVELLWTKPTGNGPYPAVLFIHGHQERIRNGGEAFVTVGRLGVMASRGYVAAAISQPGYGNSDGPPDYCGPSTQDAVLSALGFLRTMPFVKSDKVALYGYSRGAIVAAMVATRDTRLAAVVLGAGLYDFDKGYPTGLSGLDENIRMEAGTTPKAFRDRSAIYHADKIRAAVLLLHGAQDDRFRLGQVEAFAEKLRATGVPVMLKIFPNAGHSMPMDEQYREIYPFLGQFLH
jgi:dipeptidyl aminopeptidase/acylaminoacyl peptidase